MYSAVLARIVDEGDGLCCFPVCRILVVLRRLHGVRPAPARRSTWVCSIAHAHVVTVPRVAARWSAVWVALALAFNYALLLYARERVRGGGGPPASGWSS